jgi:PurA ssDNA and RNA-binding protein
MRAAMTQLTNTSNPENFASLLSGLRPNIRPGKKMDSIIESRELQIERKLFSIDLRENGRGRFLRITEDSQGHRNVIIVPISGVDDFADAIDDVLASEPAN